MVDRKLTVSTQAKEAGLQAYSDRGSQYASDHDRRVLASMGITCNMSEVGQCWDNALVESVFGRLKCERAPDEVFATHDQSRAVIVKYRDAFSKRVRLHFFLGFVLPEEFERTYNPTHR